MTFPGKNYPGQRGFPTPNSTPSTTRRRIFVVPADAEWLGLVMGAVEVLREEWRWYEWGALTPAEAAAAFNTIIIDAFENVCPPMLPGGGRVIRINPTTGRLEEGADDGTWEPPTGDYAVPPITPREGTPDDIRCLAAANAAHVLELLYESVTDSIAHELEVSEAYAALVTAFIAAVGWEFAPIAFALAAFFLAVFAVVYEIVKIIGADLWDGTFTDTLKCALYGCASADGEGVVTFDWACAQNALAAGTDALNFDQLRLFNQLNFIIQVIGGADGLNQAGATTAITEADCSGCDTAWCYPLNFNESDYGLALSFLNGGTYVPGVGWRTTDTSVSGDRTLLQGTLDLGFEITITKAALVYDWTSSECTNCSSSGSVFGYGLVDPYDHNNANGDPCTTPPGTDLSVVVEADATIQKFVIDFQTSFQCFGGEATAKHINIFGTDAASLAALISAFGAAECV